MLFFFRISPKSSITFICLSFTYLSLLPSKTHAHWTTEQIRDFAMKELATPLQKEAYLYRWGSAEYELKRTEKALGKGAVAFQLESVNLGDYPAGRGLYLSETVSESSKYVSHLQDAQNPPALVEVIHKAGSAFIDLKSKGTQEKIERAGFTVSEILRSDPPALIRFGMIDTENPGSYERSVFVAKNPEALVIRELEPNIDKVMNLKENISRILDISSNPLAANTYDLKVSPYYSNFAYARNPVTHQIQLYPVKSRFFSIAMNHKEPSYGVRLNGKCGFFVLSNSEKELILVSDSPSVDACRKELPTEIARDLNGVCSEVLRNDPRIALWPVEDRRCTELFCRAKVIYNPKNGTIQPGYSISLASHPYLNYPADPASGFLDYSSCRQSIIEATRVNANLMCIPQGTDKYQLVSLLSLTPSLPPYQTNTLGECISWTQTLNQNLKLLCEKRGNSYELVSYRDPYQHRRIGASSYATLKECQAALPSLSPSIYDNENQLDSDRARVIREVGRNHPEDLIRFIKHEYPYLKQLLEHSQQQSLEIQVRTVLSLAKDLDPSNELTKLVQAEPRISDFKGMMNLFFLMRNMGKETIRKSYQNLINEHILAHFFTKWGFSRFEVTLASELVRADSLGMMIQNQAKIQDAMDSIKRKAARSQISPELFFLLHMHLYTVETASQTPLEEQTLTQIEDGNLVPTFFIQNKEEIERLLKTQ